MMSYNFIVRVKPILQSENLMPIDMGHLRSHSFLGLELNLKNCEGICEAITLPFNPQITLIKEKDSEYNEIVRITGSAIRVFSQEIFDDGPSTYVGEVSIDIPINDFNTYYSCQVVVDRKKMSDLLIIADYFRSKKWCILDEGQY